MDTKQENRAEPDWFDRLVAEHAEMEDRAVKLRKFMVSDPFSKLDRTQQHLMTLQSQHMADYVGVLAGRIIHERQRRAQVDVRDQLMAQAQANSLSPGKH